jgi:hypothetical protein
MGKTRRACGVGVGGGKRRLARWGAARPADNVPLDLAADRRGTLTAVSAAKIPHDVR